MGLTKPRAAQIFNLDYKQATRVVTVSDINLSGGAPTTVDGVNLVKGDRVLVTGQNTGSQNGLYYVTTLGTGSNGTWARTSDSNETGEIEAGMIVMVTEGSIYADTQWKLITNDPIVVGTTALTFTQNYSANSISGGTSNVVVYSNSDVTISSAGTANIAVFGATTITATANINPAANVAYSLGNTTNRWKDIWLSNSTIYLGNVNLAATATGLTVDGNPVITAASGGNAISVTGNITGNYFIGNGSQLTGIVASSSYGNANVAAFLSSFGSNVISTTGTVTAGNVTGGNILTGGLVSATGNVTGSYIFGNGVSLTGVITSVANINNGTSNVTVVSSGGNVTVGIGGTSNIAVFSTSGLDITGRVSATGDVTAGNILSSGSISTSGTVTAASTVGGIITGSSVSVTGNIDSGNLRTAGVVSATGNISGSFFIGNGSQLTGITASGGGGIKWTTQANTAPAGANAGDFWYDSYSSVKYQYTNDGTGNFWVDQSPPTSFATLAVTGNTTSGNLSVSTGTITVGNIVNANGNAVGNIGSSSLYFNTAFLKATSAQYADLAEMYLADLDYTSGTVVEFGGSQEITQTTKSHTASIAGVVSTNPSYLMNSTLQGQHVLPVALTGRVPCSVVGSIRKGDRLVASDQAGVATVLDKNLYEPGCIIGKALENYDSDVAGVIEIAVGRY